MKNLHSPPDRLISEDDARTILGPHLPSIEEIVLDAFQGWLEIRETMPPLFAVLTTRSRACVIHDLIVQRARAKYEFPGVKGIRTFEHFGFLCLDFGGKVLVRFKKLDDAELPSNIPTHQQELISSQRQRDLPFCPPAATWATAGYRLKRAGEGIRDIIITCHYEERLVWHLPVYSAHGPARTIFPIHAHEPPATAVDNVPLVRPKVRAKSRKEANER